MKLTWTNGHDLGFGKEPYHYYLNGEEVPTSLVKQVINELQTQSVIGIAIFRTSGFKGRAVKRLQELLK